MKLAESLTGSMRRILVLVGVGLAATLTATAPAEASVTYLWAGASVAITTDHRTDPVTSSVKLSYDAFVTTDSAALEIQAGGKLSFSCFGIDRYSRAVQLFTTVHTGQTQYPLVPYGDGMYVNARFERPKGTLFDVNTAGKDILWCEASYDSKSYPFTHFFARTPYVTGYF